ncbi:MAG TPA: peptidoglycan recognition protein [Actinomycetota bacterium]|nr:peptidoglycan recognition protein [Actinomycetota bacterium]
MRSHKIVFAALLAGAVTLGVPDQVLAQPIPRALDAVVHVAPGVSSGDALERTLALPWRANTVGLSFRGDETNADSVGIDIRTRQTDGWTPWSSLHIEPEEAPDGAEARAKNPRVFTEPSWVGSADAIQIRMHTESGVVARDVRLHISNTLGDARPVNVVVRAGRLLRSVLNAQPKVAEAITSKPSITTRRQWGADERLRTCCTRYSSSVKMVFVHHTDNSNSYSRSQAPALVRGVYRYHTRSRGYSDIGYNFLVDKYGRIYEGRYGGMHRAVIGAHTLGFNSYTTGVAVVGDYGRAIPTASSQTALKRLLAWKMDIHHIPPIGRVTMTSSGNERYPRGRRVSFNRISGHRDAKPTACPGVYMYRRLSGIRTGVDRLGHPKIYLPVISSGLLRPDGDARYETVRWTSTFSRSVLWRLDVRDSSGTTVQTFTGSGTSMSQSWDGLVPPLTGTLLATGRYTWKLSAQLSSGTPATPAYGYVYIVNTHPEGTVLSDSDGRYVLEGAAPQAVAIDNDAVYRSYYGTASPILTGSAERGRYVPGAVPLLPREGALFQSDQDGSRYIWSESKLRPFVVDPVDTFAGLGYNASAVITASSAYLSNLPPGTAVNEVTVHPAGSLVRDNSGALWVIGVNERRPISALAAASRYRSTEIVPASAGDLQLAVGQPLLVADGTLLRASNGTRWIVSNGQKRRFTTAGMYAAMGYSTAAFRTAPAADLAALEDGPTIG